MAHQARASRWSEVGSGFVLAGKILLFLGWLVLALLGGKIAFDQTKPYPPSDAPLANAPPIFGWALLVIAGGVAYLTMNQWAKVLSGWLGFSVLNGLLMIESGHLVNQPNKPFPRSTASIVTFCLAVSAFFASTFVSRKLTTIDRVMLSCVGAVYLVVFWLREQLMLWGIGLITFCLGVSWWNGRVKRRHHSLSRGPSADLDDTLQSPR
jgi:hypothetical protein